MRNVIVLLVLLFTVAADAQKSAQQTCTRDQESQALDEADALKSWKEVHESFKRFAHCDDGAIAEGYSDSIVRLLAHDWKHLTDLRRLTVSDKKFTNFVLAHIDATTSDDDLRLVQHNSAEHCPAGSVQLCKAIARRADAAIRQMP